MSQSTIPQILSRLLRLGGTYGFFRVINQAGGFFVLPVYWHYLDPSDFGVLAICTAVAGILQPIMNLGMHSAVERNYHTYDEDELWSKITKLFVISSGFSVLFVLLTDLVLSTWSNYLFSDVSYSYVRYSVYTAFLLSFQYIPFAILRVTERIKQFGIVLTLSFLLQTILSLYFIAVLDMGLTGYLSGLLINAFIWCTYWLAWILRRWKAFPETRVGPEVRYSVNFVPAIFIESMSRMFDKLLLVNVITTHELGIYAQGQKIAGVYDQVNSSLKAAFVPIIYQIDAKQDNLDDQLPKISAIYFLILVFTAFLLDELAKIMVTSFASEEYRAMLDYVIIFILIAFIKSQESVWGVGLEIMRRSDVYLYVSLLMSMLSMAIIYFLVTGYGLFGALLALGLSVTIRASLFIILGHRYFKRHFPYPFIMLTLAVSGILAFVLDSINTDANMLIISGLKVLAVALVMVGLYKLLILYYNRHDAVSRTHK